MAISSVQNPTQALLSSVYGTGGTREPPSLSSIITAAQAAQEERHASRQRLTDQATALGDLFTLTDDLRTAASDLNNSGGIRLNLFGTAASTSDIKAGIESFVSKFNEFRTFVSENEDLFTPNLVESTAQFVRNARFDLESVGVTFGDDGALSIDEDTLDNALSDNLSQVESAFGGVSGLASRVQFFAENLRSTPSFRLLADIEVPDRPSFAVDLLREEQFQGAVLNLLG